MSYINLDELDVNTAREKEITEVYFNTILTLALLVYINKLFA